MKIQENAFVIAELRRTLKKFQKYKLLDLKVKFAI